MSKLNKTNFHLLLRRGLRSMVEDFVTWASSEGEIAYTTDTPALWVADSTYRFQVVPDLRQAVIDADDGNVVTDIDTGEIVWDI